MTSEKAWHAAYCRWYDADRAGHPIRAAVWGWLADRICRHLPANLTAGVNDGQGTILPPDGTDDAPDKSKGAAAYATASRPAPAVNLNEHECVFIEEREPSGRLILPPCIVCGLAAMDAVEGLRDGRGGA